jgi:2-methylcitrate dehydratase PrpD
MSIAGELARFVTRTSVDDLPPLALERARMAIASTIASAAMGRDIVSSRIIRELARERAGAPEATVWFDGGGALPVAALIVRDGTVLGARQNKAELQGRCTRTYPATSG